MPNSNEHPTKEYLGDSVYAEIGEIGQGKEIILSTENGLTVSNIIYLDNMVVANLIDYVKKYKINE